MGCWRCCMNAAAVTAAGVMALGVTVWAMVMHLDGSAAPRCVVDRQASWRRRVGMVLQRMSGVMAAGVMCGVLVLGLGSRLMMRVMAATSPASAQGRLTDAEEIVGEVTIGGTVAFVMFIGVPSGMVAAWLWFALRRWLPDRSLWAGLIAAGLAGLLVRPSGLIDPDNRDFVILSPVWLAVVFSAGLVVLFGVSFAVLADRWSAHWPKLGATPAGVAAPVPMVGVFALSVLVVMPALIMVVGVAFVVWRPALGERTSRWLAASEPLGRGVLVVLALLGAGWVTVSAVQVLTI